MIDSLAQTSFPLCMRNIHISLRREHHLRHFARRQYGLFLKVLYLDETNLNYKLVLFRALVSPWRVLWNFFAPNFRKRWTLTSSRRNMHTIFGTCTGKKGAELSKNHFHAPPSFLAIFQRHRIAMDAHLSQFYLPNNYNCASILIFKLLI